MKKSLIDNYLNKNGQIVDFSNKNNVIQPQYDLAPKKTSKATKVVAGTLAGIMLMSSAAGLHACDKQESPKSAQIETVNER